jgi:hypothetical protein
MGWMRLPGVLWAKAPFVLVQHRAVLFAVVCTSFLVALAAASAPLLRAGAESEALNGKLNELSPLAAGLTIETPGAPDPHPARADRAHRRAIARTARRLQDTDAPIVTTSTQALVGGRIAGGGRLGVVPMARTAAMEHVDRLAGGGTRAYVPSSIAKVTQVRPGDRLQLVGGSLSATPARISVPVGAIYRQLDADLSNPYWVNFVVRIRPLKPDSPLPPPFVLMRPDELYRVIARVGGGFFANTYEVPVQAGSMTPGRAKTIARQFVGLRGQLTRPTPLGRSLGCIPRCSVTSSLDDAVILARQTTDALNPVISVLAGFAALIAIAAAFVAGAFGVRRRAAEARLSVVGGESRIAFAARSALEAVVPAIVGATAGFACAAELVRLFTPAGTVDHGVFRSALVAAAVAAAGGVVAVAAGAWAARGATVERPSRRLRPGALLWEVPVLVAAAIAYVVIRHGGGLVQNAAVGAHPRLVVLCFPLLVAAGVTGLAARAARPLLRRRRPREDATYLAVRRLAAARALLVLLTVTAAVAFSAVTFAEILSRSLHDGSIAKAYVANGSDVQGLIDPVQSAPRSFPYPITKVQEIFNAAQLDDGTPVELLAVEPRTLRSVVSSSATQKLAASTAAMPVIATEDAARSKTIWIGGRQVRIQVVATVRSFPGMVAGEPLLILPEAKLKRVGGPDILLSTNAYLWARGDPAKVQPAVEHITPSPSYVTNVDYFLQNADLSTADRTYGYLRVIAVGAAVVALIALLLYLHARARAQLVTAAFLARMGMPASRQAVSTALEAAGIVLFAELAGAGSALLAARPIVTRVDPLPQWAPAATVSVPWTLVAVSFVAVVVLAAVAGAVASAFAARGDVGEALRVA